MAYPPRRPRQKSVQVALTATVVGPPGSDIHVDAMGQIKVQFHRDRAGKYDDHSSRWIRVLQPWAGAGWGHQFIPWIGMEVANARHCLTISHGCHATPGNSTEGMNWKGGDELLCVVFAEDTGRDCV